MKKGVTTIYDIARALDVSASTVSRGLRSHPDISREMIDKIKAAAKKMNYKPNTIAQSLKERRTKVIGVLFPELTSHLYISALNGMEEMAYKKGYQLIVTKSNESYQREALNMQSLVGQVDGILACPTRETRKTDHFKAVRELDIPLVFFDRLMDRIGGSYVTFNYEKIAYNLTEHLLRSGYQRIAFLGGASRTYACRKLIAGIRSAHENYKAVFSDECCVTDVYGQNEGRLAFQRLRQMAPAPDAVIAGDEALATAVALEVQTENIQVGWELGVATVGSAPFFGLLSPSITSCQPHGFELGALSVQICINEIESEGKTKPRREALSNEIALRNSTVRVNRGLVVSSYSKLLNSKEGDVPLIYIY